jgi:hypothetical protein
MVKLIAAAILSAGRPDASADGVSRPDWSATFHRSDEDVGGRASPSVEAVVAGLRNGVGRARDLPQVESILLDRDDDRVGCV